ncbi:MAG: thioredoxin family protein [Bacteroidota bacterium]
MRPLLLLLGLLVAAPLAAQADDPSPHSEAALVADADAVEAGTAVDVALRLDLDEGWHSYWINPGDSGLPVTVEWTLPDGVTVGPLRHPYPSRYDIAGLTSYAFEGSPHFLARLAVPEGFDAEAVEITGTASWLVCADVCLQAEETASLTIPVGAPTEAGLLDAARSMLPVKAEGWAASATVTEAGYALVLDPPDGWTGTLDGAQFYVDTPGVIDHPAEQAYRQEGGAWAAALAASPYAEAPAERLRGVLVAPEGTAFADGARAIEVDALVASGDLAASVGASGPEAGMGIWTALGFAFLGGMILNLMPCVFPVLSIKILGFVQGREDDRATLRKHGLVFAAGVLVSFLALAGALLALRAAGEGLGWGFQLQSPAVVAALAALMALLGLNLLGVFEVGQGLMTAGARLDKGEGTGGAFFSGVLATVVATPCTAPFMGAALGFAIAQPAAVALTIFAALGVGMALPYVLLSFNPSLLRRLPRPGPWMETLKQALAFPLFATAVWLVWVFGLQAGINGAAALLMALVLLGFAAWLWGRWAPPAASGRPLAVARTLALLTVLGAGALVVMGARGADASAASATSADGWEAFDPEAVETLVAAGEPVFIDFTAAWCLTCQVNKTTALNTETVKSAFAERGVTAIRADWTNEDPQITAYLDRYGRSGVPFYLFYPEGNGEPVLIDGVLTPQIVLDALGGVQTAAR